MAMTKTPGPGAYTIPDKIKEGPEFSIGMNLDPNDGKAVPGPGAYSPPPQHQGGKSATKFGSELRLRASLSKIPGPGDYEIAGSADGPKWSWGKDQRVKDPKLPNDVTYDVPPTIPNVARYNLN